MGSALACAVVREKPLATLRLSGALSGENVRSLGGRLSELMRDGHRYLVLEMSELSEVAPVCVGVLNRAVSQLRQVEGSLTLRGLDPVAVRALTHAGLHPSVLVSA